MKKTSLKLKKHQFADYYTYIFVTLVYIALTILISGNMLSSSLKGQLVPICCYIVMALSLNLTVGVLGELSLGHAGFMSVGAFTGVLISGWLSITAQNSDSGSAFVKTTLANPDVRLVCAILTGALMAAIVGFLIGIPVLRLRGDYLAIVTLAFGEIIKELMTSLLIGVDKNGLHVIFNLTGKKTASDLALVEEGNKVAKFLIKGAQGATGTQKIATFTAGFILIIVSLIIILNLMHSRSGRAIMALRDNRIAAESIGINITKYKLMAFITSAALAGAAGALFGLNISSFASGKFDFNQSIMILVFVVLGGLGNMWGSIIAATVLTVLPEVLREFNDYRMLIYAIVLILVMLATNNPELKTMIGKINPFKKKGGADNG